MTKPFINFRRPSLLTLATAAVRGDMRVTSPLHVRYPSTRGLPHSFASAFDALLTELKFFLPDEAYIATVAETLMRGLDGEPVTLISPVCPDYAYVRHGARFRYTFSGLGDGIGLVARRAVDTLPRVADLLQRHGIRTTIVIAAGDFEGFNPATLARLGESRESFARKLRKSQERIRAALPCAAGGVMISDLAGGADGWRALTQRAYASVAGGDLGGLLLTRTSFEAILEARRPLYRAWHGELGREAMLEILLRQCAEYAAMGLLFARQMRNPLVIGADHPRMMPFYWLYGRVPVLYLQRAY